MKIFIYILALVCACDATLFSLFGGSSGGGGDKGSLVGEAVGSSSGGGVSHGGEHSPQVIKVILQQGHGNGDHSHIGGYAYGGGSAGSGHTQIYKIISQSGGSHGEGHAGYSDTQAFSNSYARGYSYGGSNGDHGSHAGHGSHISSSHSSVLEAILPQILQLILEDDGHSSIGAYNQQLLDHYGHKGKAIVKRQGKLSSMAKYFKSGHVVEKGVLKYKRVDNNNGVSKKLFGGGGNSGSHASSHGSSHDSIHGHGHVPVSSGWSSGW